MKPEVWGPPIWTLFHVLAEKINEKQFPMLIVPLFSYIKRICKYLPCPDCSDHATITLSTIRMEQIDTKDKLRVSLFIFHNSVNRKKNKPLFQAKDLVVYSRMSLQNVWRRFVAVYNTKGNMQMLSESFQRELIMKEFRKWFGTNITCFLQPIPLPSLSTSSSPSTSLSSLEPPLEPDIVPVLPVQEVEQVENVQDSTIHIKEEKEEIVDLKEENEEIVDLKEKEENEEIVDLKEKEKNEEIVDTIKEEKEE